MKKALLLAILILPGFRFSAQTPDFKWAKSFGGTQVQQGVGLSVDPNGNVYSSGYFNGNADLDPGAGTFNLASTGIMSSYVSKLDAQGNFLWARQIAGTFTASKVQVYGQALCANGDIYVGGSFEGIVDFDPGASSFTVSASAGDGFILKLDASGNFLWAKSFGGTNVDLVNELAVDPSGAVYSTGFFIGSVDFDPSSSSVYNMATLGGLPQSFVLKLDAAGNFGWATQLSSTGGTIGNGICVDQSGRVITAGTFRMQVDFDPGPGQLLAVAVGLQDAYVWKLDAQGNYLLATVFGGNFNDVANNVVSDPAGNMYVSGTFAATCDLDPGPGVTSFTSLGGNDIFVMQLSQAGNLNWAKHVGGIGNEAVGGLSLDANNDVYYAGFFDATVDFDPGAGTNNLVATAPNTFISKLGNAGNFMWAKQLPGPGYNAAAAIAVDAATSIYATGNFSTSINFDPAMSNFTIPALGNQDAFVLKLTCATKPVVTASSNNATICYGNSATLTASGALSYTWSNGGNNSSSVVSPSTTTVYTVTGADANACASSYSVTQFIAFCTAIGEVDPGFAGLSAFPNPVTDHLNIQWQNDSGNDNYSIELSDLLGRRVFTIAELKGEAQLSLQELLPGIYFLKLYKAGNCLQSLKILKE